MTSLVNRNNFFEFLTLASVFCGFFGFVEVAKGVENWPELHGPTQNGHAGDTPVPTTWNEDQNIRWKCKIHGEGWSSPVIWEEQIWLATATKDGKKMYAVCVDKRTGEIVHDLKLFENAEPRFKHKMNSYASPTPVIEDGFVYVSFGSYGTACVDTKTGEKVWERRDLPCNHWRGPGSSPILFRDLLILTFDGYDYQYLAALNKRTGKTVWKVDRQIDYQTDDGDRMKAYCTPIITKIDDRIQMVSPTSMAVIAYDPTNGEEIWRVGFKEFSATARPIHVGDWLFVNTGFGKAQLYGIRAGGEGDLTESNVQWTVKKSIGSKPSSVVVDGLIYGVHDAGVMTCIDGDTGNAIWTKRLGGNYSASLLYAGGHIYVSSDEGKTTVVKPGREFNKVAVNQLGDGFMSSPSVAGKSLYLRSRSHLYRIEEESP